MSVFSFRCHHYAFLRCLARVTIGEYGEYEESGRHNHGQELMLVEEYKFLNECKRRAATDAATSRHIFDEVCRL